MIFCVQLQSMCRSMSTDMIFPKNLTKVLLHIPRFVCCVYMYMYMYIRTTFTSTVFPRNLAAARFYFKAPFGAATIRGRLDFEGGVYRDRYARTYTASIISLARKMSLRIRKLLSTLYHTARFRGRRLLGRVGR